MKVILVDAINAFVIKDHGIFAQMLALLERYPNRKILLTGANDEEFERFGLGSMPYEVFTLKHDPEKKDPKYYLLMLERFRLRKEDVVYFEHNADAARSAASVGIVTHHYDKDKKDLDSLKEFLDRHL